MTQPLDRTCQIEAQGEIDHAAGEFWVNNPFELPANGHNLSSYERNRLFLNRDGQSFLDVSYASRADIDADSRSVVAADFDRDGAPDLLVHSVGGGPLRLFLNRFPKTARRLRLKLVGVESNRPAIGTRVIAHCGARQIVRDLFPPNGFTGQGPPELHLGQGDAPRIDRLQVRWPTGREQTFENLPAEGVVTITEGQAEFAVEAADAS